MVITTSLSTREYTSLSIVENVGVTFNDVGQHANSRQLRKSAHTSSPSPTNHRMGSNASKPKPSSPLKSKFQTALTPRLPQEIIDEILDHLATDFRSLRSCALVSKSWVPSCRQPLFHTVVLTKVAMKGWLQSFPLPEESPAHLVKNLQIWTGPTDYVPEKFFEYIPWFTNVKRLSLLGDKGVVMMRRHLLWRSPQSVTSLTLNTGRIFLVDLRDIMAGLPNLDNLCLSGKPLTDGRALEGIGTVLKGRFGGKLQLCHKNTSECVTNMLLEVPPNWNTFHRDPD